MSCRWHRCGPSRASYQSAAARGQAAAAGCRVAASEGWNSPPPMPLPQCAQNGQPGIGLSLVRCADPPDGRFNSIIINGIRSCLGHHDHSKINSCTAIKLVPECTHWRHPLKVFAHSLLHPPSLVDIQRDPSGVAFFFSEFPPRPYGLQLTVPMLACRDTDVPLETWSGELREPAGPTKGERLVNPDFALSNKGLFISGCDLRGDLR